MPAINIVDLSNAKLDVDHMAEIATSTELTATDRLGHTKRTLAGLSDEFPNAAANAETATVQAEIATTGAALAATQAGLAASAKTAAELAADSAVAASSAKPYSTLAKLTASPAPGPTAEAWAVVTNDATAANNGFHSWLGGAWVKSALQPVMSADALPHRGDITTGVLKSYSLQGIYFLPANSTFTDMPYGALTADAYVLTNTKATSSGRYVHQVLRQIHDPKVGWTRRIDNNVSTVPDWKRVDIGEYNGTLPASADLNNPAIYSLLGDWVFTVKPVNAPAGVSASGTFSARLYGSFVLQEVRDLTTRNARILWRRWCRPAQAEFGDWGRVTDLDHGANGVIDATGDLNTILDPDAYPAGWVLTAAPAHAPAGYSGGGILKLSKTGNWLEQSLSPVLNPSSVWRRRIRTDTNPMQFRDWDFVGPVGTSTRERWVFFGDSITEFGTYPELVGAALNLEVVKAGFGGCRMANHTWAEYDAMCMYKLSGYVASGNYEPLIQAADALFVSEGDDNRPQSLALSTNNWGATAGVVILFGTNDFQSNIPIGTNADSTGATFKGAINMTVSNLLDSYPHLNIMFAAPFYRSRTPAGSSKDSDGNPNSIGAYLKDYGAAIKELCGIYHLPFVDLYDSIGINKKTAATLIPDGVHPAQGAGYKRVAERVGGSMRQFFMR